MEILSDGTISEMNSALRRMLGLGCENMGPAHFSECIADEDIPGDQSNLFFQQLINGARENFQIESEVPGSGGAWARWTVWRVGDEIGAQAKVAAMADDITELRQSQQRLLQSEKLESVGRLACGVAHDFNNLLTGVLLYCDLLLTDVDSGPRSRKYAEEIRAACFQANGLVRQLLAIASPQGAIPRPLSLNEIADGMRSLLERLVGEDIELKLLLDPELGPVRMDPTQAQQILLNLVLNARDALPGGGEIAIETRNCEVQIVAQNRFAASPSAAVPCALFIVSDNGHGMDDRTRSHIFEAFFTTKAAGKGTGLGLATVHDIVTRSGGLIHVDSAPECGTRVTVLLPQISGVATDDPKAQVFRPPLPQTSTTLKKEPTP